MNARPPQSLASLHTGQPSGLPQFATSLDSSHGFTMARPSASRQAINDPKEPLAGRFDSPLWGRGDAQ
jgi:hypothetical protein